MSIYTNPVLALEMEERVFMSVDNYSKNKLKNEEENEIKIVFYIKKEFFDALQRGDKKIEIRIGERWVKIAEKIQNKIALAFFKYGSRTIVREIWKVELYPSIRAALGAGRWRLLGLKANTYYEAIYEVNKLYQKLQASRLKKSSKVVLFWLRKRRNS